MLTINELKKLINEKKVPEKFLVLVCEENRFIANQYINAIIANNDNQYNKINSIFDTTTSSSALVFDYSDYINILDVEIFDEIADDYSKFNNVIVICDKLDKKLPEEINNFVIKIPKLLDWQVKAYMQTICAGLTSGEINRLYEVTKGDIYRINNELYKIAPFDKEIQAKVCQAILADPNTDLYTYDFFKIINAIINRDFDAVYDYFKHRKLIDLDPMSLIANLLRNFKNIAFIFLNSGVKPTDLGLTDKQVYAMSKAYNRSMFSETSIMRAIDFLTSINLKLCAGELTLQEDYFTDYIICSLFKIFS